MAMGRSEHANREFRVVRRVMVILSLTVSLKLDAASVLGSCTLIEGTSGSESQDDNYNYKQVVFSQVTIEKKGEMDCKSDYAAHPASKYSTPKCALATCTASSR